MKAAQSPGATKSTIAPTPEKTAPEKTANPPEINPVWHRLATHSTSRAGKAAASDPPPPRTSTGAKSFVQRLCAHCGDGLAAQTPPAQAKLTVGAPHDEYEREADSVAERVMRMPATPAPPVDEEEVPALQAKPIHTPRLQRLCAGCEEDAEELGAPGVQTKAETSAANRGVPPSVHGVVSNPGAGAPLHKDVRARIESGVGVDLATVRVHSDMSAQQAARSINAKAFTHRDHIYLGRGQSPTDLGLMAHEAMHVVQQQAAGERIQRASLIAEGERGVIVNPTRSPVDFGTLVSLVRRRFDLDGYASWQLARWLDEKHGIFRYGSPIYDREVVVPMPRMVAFFLVDWVEPFNPYSAPGSAGAQYRITPEAFAKAQRIWSDVDVFVGFRRGGPVGGASFEQIEFTPPTLPSGEASRVTQEEQDLLALRSAAAMPPGYFHIVVTGLTSEDPTTTGKAIRSRAESPVRTGSEGILLFAGTYSRLGYRQVAPEGSSDQELGELLAHEIGHFLFNLGHYEEPITTAAGTTIPEKTDIMRPGERMDPRDHLGAASRAEIAEALSRGEVARPEIPTSR